jgi:CRISPR-associated protein Cmr3
MSWYFLRPHGPLLVGDGRSYGGSSHRASLFPTPQAVLGAARTRAGQVLGFDWDGGTADAALQQRTASVVGDAESPGALGVGGVFFALRQAGRAPTLHLPRPADGLVIPPPPGSRPGTEPTWHPRRPMRVQGARVSPPHGLTRALAPLGHRAPASARKPMAAPADWLALSPFLALLHEPKSHPMPFVGVEGPRDDERTHVVIADDTLASQPQGLFSAGRLAFDRPLGDAAEGGLAVELTGDDALSLDGLWRLGGKGSLAHATAAAPEAVSLDTLRSASLEAIDQAEGRLRWVLVTPARFRRGWLPDFLDDGGEGEIGGSGVRVRLVAAAVARPLAYSGWDLAADGSTAGRARGKPRPTRYLAPAGSVYFFEVVEGGSAAARRAAEAGWLESLARIEPHTDDPAERRATAIDAACGLARGVFGPWNWHEETQP